MKPPFKGVIYYLFCSFFNFFIKIKRAQILLRVGRSGPLVLGWLKPPNLVVVPATLSLSYALKPRSLARRVFEIQVSTVPLCGVRSRPAVYWYIIAKLSSSWQVQLNLSWRKLCYHCQWCPTGPDPTWPEMYQKVFLQQNLLCKTCFTSWADSIWKTPSIFFQMEDDLNFC